MATLKDVKRIVIKVGTSTLTHHTGKSNIRQIKKLVAVISDIVNSGVEVALVTSGAIGVGVGKLGLRDRPTNTAGKQAAATIGQCELMFMYDKMFAEFGHTVGQFLITKRDVDNDECRENLINAFEKTFEYGAIPIINENDAVAVEEIVFGDNDSLSAIVAKLIKADALLILTDIDGLYTDDPHKNPEARLLKVVDAIDENIYGMAKESTGSNVGTGGMATKLAAAKIATLSGTDMIIANGGDVRILQDIFENDYVGTLFTANENANFNLANYIMETIG